MKFRVPVLFVLFLCGGLLAWLLAPERHEAKPAPAPYWAEQIDDLNKLGRHKHATAAEYTNFAATANAEQAAGEARLFRALARSEQVHEICCADAARRLGGHYTPPAKVVIFHSRTPANLTRALDEELQNYDYYRAGCIERAEAAGNRYAALTIIRIAGGDMQQIGLLDCAVRGHNGSDYAVCPLCGNIFRAERCPPYCPFCQSPEEQFIRFE